MLSVKQAENEIIFLRFLSSPDFEACCLLTFCEGKQQIFAPFRIKPSLFVLLSDSEIKHLIKRCVLFFRSVIKY